MGLDITAVRYHCWLKKQGVEFTRVAMLGRHSFYGLNAARLAKAVTSSGLDMTEDVAQEILTRSGGYAEPFYEWLGAEVVDSFDYSDYEQASHIWNMNENLPAKFEGLYDFVFDGGTLEHVFRYCDALRESMTMPKPGGVFLSATPANSFLGHGLYQFSPDLPFSVMRKENGYELGGIHLVEMRHRSVFHRVLPPSQARGRALASTTWPALMYFWGRRIGEVSDKLEVFQPDYEAVWSDGCHSERGTDRLRPWIANLANVLSYDRRNDLLRFLKLGYSTIRRNAFFDRRCFQPDKSI